jgi:hypothetical protein
MAIRLNFKIGGGDYDENYYSPILNDLSSYDIESSLNIQYYLSRRNFVKPFLSVGPTYSKNHNYRPEKGKAFYWYDDWSLGIMLTLGTEIFIYDNIGIIGEYVIKGSYKKSIYQNYNSYELLESDNKIITFSANTARLGFSVYF